MISCIIARKDFRPRVTVVLKWKHQVHFKKRRPLKMSWSSQQQRRLGMEKGILESKLNNVTWYNPTSAGKTRVEWRVNTNNDNSYTLRVYITGNFPNEYPILVVSSPSSPLPKSDSSLLDSVSVTDHTYGAYDGLTQICHFHTGKWTSENTLYQVFMKGRIWLEAYEIHRRTGQDLEKYLAHMQWLENVRTLKHFGGEMPTSYEVVLSHPRGHLKKTATSILIELNNNIMTAVRSVRLEFML